MKIAVNLRREEIEQLLYMLDIFKHTGDHYGIRKHYVKRHHDIKCKLIVAIKALENMTVKDGEEV